MTLRGGVCGFFFLSAMTLTDPWSGWKLASGGRGERGQGMNIVVLTGAGISAESGISTFRAADGLWENHRIEDVASPEGFLRDPALVHHFYNLRRGGDAAGYRLVWGVSLSYG
jgi:hypothetical protein